jgi:hypothetical protein
VDDVDDAGVDEKGPHSVFRPRQLISLKHEIAEHVAQQEQRERGTRRAKRG